MAEQATKTIVKASHKFSASPERVYETWLDEEKARQWMQTSLKEAGLPGQMLKCEIDAKEGGKFFLSDQRDQAIARHWGNYSQLKKGEVISFTWITDEGQEKDPSKVTIKFKPEGTGCTANLEHEIDSAWSDFSEKISGSWTRMLKAIDKLLAVS